MNYFKLASPYGKMPDDKIWQGINGDPTMKREEYVFVRKPVPSFEQIWDVFAKTNNKTERLGCASLFYFKYYLELRDKIREVASERKQLTANNKILKILILDFLSKWLEFIKRSDNTLYPQNNVFIEIKEALKPAFPNYLD